MIENSDALESARRSHSAHPFSLMASSTFQSPGMNNLDSHLNKMDMIPHDRGASGGGKHLRAAASGDGASGSSESSGGGQHQPGYMLKHSVAANYEFSPGYLFGPVLGLSEPFSGRHDGQVLFDDPQLRFTMLDLYQAKIAENTMHSSMMISAYLPVSDSSRHRSSKGALSVASSPRLHFHGTPYSIMATSSLKSGLYGRSEGNSLISTRLSGGVQGSYRVTHTLDSGLMIHISTQFGPNVQSGDSETDGSMKERGSQTVGIMPSLKYQPTQSLTFTPRLNWYLDQPLRTTTVSVAAMMRLI